MYNLDKNLSTFNRLTESNDDDIYELGWINMKAVKMYNEIQLENVPTIIVKGKGGYARFQSFKYKNFIIPYQLTISDGLYVEPDTYKYDISLSPYPHVLFCYISIDMINANRDMMKYYNSRIVRDKNGMRDRDKLKIFSDSLEMLLLAIIDMRSMELNMFDERDYNCNVIKLMCDSIDIPLYLKLLSF